MKIKTKNLCKNIIFNKIDDQNFKTNYLTFDFLIPISKENATNISLIGDVLLAGSQKFGEMDKLSAYLEKLYGASISSSVTRFGENLSFCIWASCLKNKFAINGENILKSVLDVFFDIMLNPITENGGFKNEYVLREKRNLKDKISAQFNDKKTYSMILLKENMFKDEKYGVSEMGDIETLKNITAKSLYEFYFDILKKAKIVITFNGEDLGVESIIKDYFEKYLTDRDDIIKTEIKNEVISVKELSQKFMVEQSKLSMGFRLGKSATENIYATRLFNVIFGASAVSKLFLNVREKMSLCYYCASSVDTVKNVMFVSSGIENDKYEIAKNEILKQLSDIQNANITDEEFENAKKYMLDSLSCSKDSQSFISLMIVSNIIGGNNKTIDEQIKIFENLEIKDIIKASKDIKLDTIYLLKGEGKD